MDLMGWNEGTQAVFNIIREKFPEYSDWVSAGSNKKRKIIDKWVCLGSDRSTQALNNLVRASYEGKSLDASRGLKNVFFKIIAETMASGNPSDAKLVMNYIESGVQEALVALDLQGSSEVMQAFIEIADSAPDDMASSSDIRVAKAPDDQFFSNMVDLLVKSFDDSKYALDYSRNSKAGKNEFLFDVECSFGSETRLVQGLLKPEGVEYDLLLYRINPECPYWPSNPSIDDIDDFVLSHKILVGLANAQAATTSVLYIKESSSELSLNAKSRGTFLSDHGLGSFAVDRLGVFILEVEMLEKSFDEILKDFYGKDR